MSATYHLDGFIGEGGATAAAIATFLTENPARATVYVNSPGGIAAEGAAIMAELQRHGRVTAIVQGLAASAASLAVMGAGEIVIHQAAMIMIHDPHALTIGPAETHRKMAGTLDKLGDVYAEGYARATGNPVAMVRGWMRAETWLDADEALALRFADRIEKTGDARALALACAGFDFSIYRNPPNRLLSLSRASDRTATPPASTDKEVSHA